MLFAFSTLTTAFNKTTKLDVLSWKIKTVSIMNEIHATKKNHTYYNPIAPLCEFALLAKHLHYLLLFYASL